MPSSSAVLKEGETLPRQIRLSKATKMETHTFVVLMMNCAFKRNLQDWLITNYARVKQLSQDHNHITTHIGGTCSEGCAHALVEGEPCVRRAAAPPASISPAGVKVGVKTQADVKAELWLSWTHIFWDCAEVSSLRKCFSLSVFACSQELFTMLHMQNFQWSFFYNHNKGR